jgi:hypothetical protein
MPCVECIFGKPFEIHRASHIADLGGVHLLQAKDVSFESFKLWSEHGRPLLKGGAMPAPVAEAFEVEGGDAHGELGLALKLRQASLVVSTRIGAVLTPLEAGSGG